MKIGAVALKIPAKPLEIYFTAHDSSALPPVIIKMPAMEPFLISVQVGNLRD